MTSNAEEVRALLEEFSATEACEEILRLRAALAAALSALDDLKQGARHRS